MKRLSFIKSILVKHILIVLMCGELWTDLRRRFKIHIMNPFKTVSKMVGPMEIMSTVYSYSRQMKELGQQFSMHLVHFMILQWHIMVSM